LIEQINDSLVYDNNTNYFHNNWWSDHYNTLLNNKKIFKKLLESKQTISTLMQISSKNQKGRAVQEKLKKFFRVVR